MAAEPIKTLETSAYEQCMFNPIRPGDGEHGGGEGGGGREQKMPAMTLKVNNVFNIKANTTKLATLWYDIS